jgi:hypothetical protein
MTLPTVDGMKRIYFMVNSDFILFLSIFKLFTGIHTSNFTSTKQLFLEHPHIKYWRFETNYNFGKITSSSSLIFVRNECPSNGFCSIYPLNGTTNTLFTVLCPDWFDKDNIKDYALYCM